MYSINNQNNSISQPNSPQHTPTTYPRIAFIKSKQKGCPRKYPKINISKNQEKPNSYYSLNNSPQNSSFTNQIPLIKSKNNTNSSKPITPFNNTNLQQRINSSEVNSISSTQNHNNNNNNNIEQSLDLKQFIQSQLQSKKNRTNIQRIQPQKVKKIQSFEDFLQENTVEINSPGKMESKILTQEQNQLLNQKLEHSFQRTISENKNQNQLQNSIQDGVFYHLPISTKRNPSINQGIRPQSQPPGNYQNNSIQNNKLIQQSQQQQSVRISNVSHKMKSEQRPITSYLTMKNKNQIIENQKLKVFTHKQDNNINNKNPLVQQNLKNINNNTSRAQSSQQSQRKRTYTLDYQLNQGYISDMKTKLEIEQNQEFQEQLYQSGYGTFLEKNIARYDYCDPKSQEKELRKSYQLGFFSVNNSPENNSSKKQKMALTSRYLDQSQNSNNIQIFKETKEGNPILRKNQKLMKPQYMKKYSLIFNRVFDNNEYAKRKFE